MQATLTKHNGTKRIKDTEVEEPAGKEEFSRRVRGMSILRAL